MLDKKKLAKNVLEKKSLNKTKLFGKFVFLLQQIWNIFFLLLFPTQKKCYTLSFANWPKLSSPLCFRIQGGVPWLWQTKDKATAAGRKSLCLILDLYFREEEIQEVQDHWEETAVDSGRKREGASERPRKAVGGGSRHGNSGWGGNLLFLFDINVFLRWCSHCLPVHLLWS